MLCNEMLVEVGFGRVVVMCKGRVGRAKPGRGGDTLGSIWIHPLYLPHPLGS